MDKKPLKSSEKIYFFRQRSCDLIDSSRTATKWTLKLLSTAISKVKKKNIWMNWNQWKERNQFENWWKILKMMSMTFKAKLVCSWEKHWKSTNVVLKHSLYSLLCELTTTKVIPDQGLSARLLSALLLQPWTKACFAKFWGLQAVLCVYIYIFLNQSKSCSLMVELGIGPH